MVLSIERLRLFHKPNLHQKSGPMSSSLQNFRSELSDFLNHLILKYNPGSKFLSLPWIHNCYEMLHESNKAFAKLVVNIDYPMDKWGDAATEEYLNYSLNLLNLLNSISFSLSHMNQATLQFSLALSLVSSSPSSAIDNLKNIQLKGLYKDFKIEGLAKSDEVSCSGKESVVLQALLAMKSTGLWVLGMPLSVLCSDVKPYQEIRKSAAMFDDSLLKDMESRVFDEIMKKHCVVDEVEEINSAAASLAEAIPDGRWNDAAQEMKRRLDELENSMQDIEKQTNHLFNELLAARDKLLDCFRHTRLKL